jgi:hypothetical protein
MVKLLQMLVTCLCLSIQLNAQVEPPIIRCITNDTLFYTPVQNSCGPFVSYEVFSSSNPNGPFSLVSQITDNTADFYIDANTSNQILFYFIRPLYDCPGQTVINSDTISNRPPEVPILQTVSVVNGEVELSWDPSPSPETEFYSVFLVTNSGLVLVGETPSTITSIIDSNNNPNVMSLDYVIAANDDCRIQSVFGDPFSSVFLSNTINSCTGEVLFEWNKHQNVEKQELWVIDGSGQSTFLESLSADAELFTTTLMPNNSFQGFFIRGFINEQENEFADSNISPISVDVSEFIDQIFFTTVETIDENTIALEWCWNERANLQSYEVFQNGPSGINTLTENLIGPNTGLVRQNIDATNTNDEAYSFQISSTDICNRIFDSGEIKSINLQVAPVTESTLDIEWSDYEYADASLINYELHEVIGGDDKVIFTGNQNRFTQNRTINGEEACYYIVAIANGVLLDGSSKNTSITSNTACTRGLPVIRLPNAFNPYGINSIFRPLFGNTDAISKYEMNVFSRYGEQLFFTNVLEEGWNGRSGLTEMPQGVYTYLVKIDIMNGETIIKQGSVLLIR